MAYILAAAGQLGLDEVLNVPDALQAMQEAVRSGRIPEAHAIGRHCLVPLSLTAADLQLASAPSTSLSQGTQSSVLAGRLGGQDVVVKKVRISGAADLDRYRNELRALAQCNHPHIIALLGAKALPPDYLLVMPREHASMREMMYEHAWRPSWDAVLRTAVQLAQALQHVHAHGLIHRDVKPANVLLDAHLSHAKLTDFGLCVHAAESCSQHLIRAPHTMRGPTGGFHKHHMVGTLEYLAPEILMIQPHTPAADVYAFAITINELATAVVPYSDCEKATPDPQTVLEMGYSRAELVASVCGSGSGQQEGRGLRPKLPAASPPGFNEIMSACWANAAADRPSWEAVLSSLAHMQGLLPCWRRAMQHGQGFHGPVVSLPLHPTWHEHHQHEQHRGISISSGDSQRDASDDRSMQGSVEGMDAHMAHAPAAPAAPHGGGETAAEQWMKQAGQSYRPRCMAGVYESVGPRDRMEDRHVLVQHGVLLSGSQAMSTSSSSSQSSNQTAGGFAPGMSLPRALAHPDVHLLAVFDGHRGAEAAIYCHDNLLSILGQALDVHGSPSEALSQTFLQLEAGYYHQWQEHEVERALQGSGAKRAPGCTATVALVIGAELFVANAGDSSAMLGRRYEAIMLAQPHTPALPEEHARLTAAGVPLRFMGGSWRIGAAGLQVSRAIGDFDIKCLASHHPHDIAPSLSDMAMDDDSQSASQSGSACVTASRSVSGSDCTNTTSHDADSVSDTAAYGNRTSHAGILFSQGEGHRDSSASCKQVLSSTLQPSFTSPSITATVSGIPADAAAYAATLSAAAKVGCASPAGQGSVPANLLLGVTAQAEVIHTVLSGADEVVVVGSDGLWDWLPAGHALQLLRDTVKEPTMAARRLVTEALARGSTDNVTALVIFLRPVNTLQQIYSSCTDMIQC